MYPLVQDSRLGTLEFHKIYEEYDGPKLFSAVNALGIYYLVYWIDELEDGDTWLYVPMSYNRLEKLESASRSLRDAFIYPEENSIFRIFTSFDGEEETLTHLTAEELTEEELPPIDYRIECELAPEQEVVSSITNHEIHISKPSRRGIMKLDSISKILEGWSSLYDEFVRTINISDRLVPVDARPGSFIVRLESNHYEKVSPVIDDFFGVLTSSEDIHTTLLSMKIDVDVVKEFLSLVVDSSYDFKLTPLIDGSFPHQLSKSAAERILTELKTSELTYLSSLRVPQADDLKRVFDVVIAKSNFQEVNEFTLGITSRQVAYYLHAARTLGYLDRSNQPTSAGMQFGKLDENQRLKSAAMRFQSSDCGWTWISWASGKTLADIPNGSAFEFLQDCVPTLNVSTARRRSKTLNSWLKLFKPITE
ncbi:DUF6575 domain-containing protein [Vibrio sp. 10N.261.52.A1]|uniref:DUF6575 domain-containing protein n=1 Tax=Vibrio sp. 10N.261.52.A1 TaxID=1880849 RepID=UPI000C842961|nr:DUF6575 domain-containing protein [Vibrio sp. 10N.261.52.A1]PML73729.1 hypothetical protein BCT81_05840 [Vibrio sp. 10N.261.52.A1]